MAGAGIRRKRIFEADHDSPLNSAVTQRGQNIVQLVEDAVRRGNVAPVHDCAGGQKGQPDAGVEDAGAAGQVERGPAVERGRAFSRSWVR